MADNATITSADDNSTVLDRAESAATRVTSRCFASCEGDPRGSVHRAWALSLAFVVLFFVVAFFEANSMRKEEGSAALLMASVWTIVVHFALVVIGTFVLKRFTTSFAVGFLLGFVVIVANQNLLLFVTFSTYEYGDLHLNHIFATLALSLFLIFLFFALILWHFKEDILVAPAETKGVSLGRKRKLKNRSEAP